MLEWLRERMGEDEKTDYSIEYQETKSAFESLLDADGVSTGGNTQELLERFEEILSRYDDISAEITTATNEITEDGEVTLWDTIGNERLPEWQNENGALVAEIESLNEEFDQLIEELDLEESKVDEDGPITELNSLYRKLNSAEWLTVTE